MTGFDPYWTRIFRDQSAAPPPDVRCTPGQHEWVLMTTGRAGFVKWDRCSRGCGEQRIRKGSG